ncbi:MAG: hypothetical protein Q9227_005119 [Pyrenula ochraceoflavens]
MSRCLLFRHCQTQKPRLWTRAYSSIIDDDPPIKVTHYPAPHSGSIKLLSLNRPDTRNALSRRMVAQLADELSHIEAQGGTGSTRALIIASESNKAFCAGADLKERKTFTPSETAEFLNLLRKTFTRLSRLQIPSISSIASVALGGGLEFGLCTHFRVFGSSAIAGLPETRLAIIPGAGGTYRLPELIGVNRARDLILTGRRVSGAEAYFIGLCDRLVEVTAEDLKEENKARTKVLDESLKLARDLCEGGPIALRQAMKAVENWKDGAKSENDAYKIVLRSKDRIEALQAFAEKRPPVFKGE